MQLAWSTLISIVGVLCCSNLIAQDKTGDEIQNDSQSRVVEIDHSIARFSLSLTAASVKAGEEVTLCIRAVIQPGWHIGAINTAPDSPGFPTQIRFEPVGLEAIDDKFVASIEPQEVTLGVGTQLLMEGEFSWSRKYRLLASDGRFGGAGELRFQACDDTKCLPPQTVRFELGDVEPKISVSMPADSVPSDKAAIRSEQAGAVVAEKNIGAPIVLSLEPCELTRTRPQIGNIVSLLLLGRSTDKMVWKGTISAGPNQGVSIYLPKARKYSLNNTGADSTIVSNTATFVSVDQDADGVLSDWEAAAADLPIRVRDTMYRITDIDVESMTLTLQQVDMPLRGSIVGFRCPDFEYTALDGSTISNQSILGKTTVLDIWAVTCHNCYEGFPKIQRSLDKHSSDKLQVVLLTVDTNRQFYDSQATRLFETYGGGAWPQVMIPGGFDGALTIGNYGFGSVIVDSTGIVRAVGVHGHNIESVIDEVIAQAPKESLTSDGPLSFIPKTAVRVTLDRQTWQDCFPGLSDRLEAMRANNELLTKEKVDALVQNPLGFAERIQTLAQEREALSPEKIAERLRKSKIYIGWYYKCNHCDNWHLNFGAGFPVAEDGIIATCHHVIVPTGIEMREGYLVAIDSDGHVHQVEHVIAADKKADCALVKISGAENLPALPLNLEPRVGDEVFVLSNPMGLSDYFSNGLINRIYVDSSKQELTEDDSARLMRINVGAEWAPGSSGAPIVDQRGNLVGFVCAARQMMGPAGQPLQADGTPDPGAVSGLTTLLTAHEAGTATAIQMLIESAKQ